MPTATKENRAAEKTTRERRTPVPVYERMKNQLTTATIRGRVKKEELDSLESHIGKLKGLIDL